MSQSKNCQGATALRVLVVDDNEDAADMLCMALEIEGHAPVHAYDAAQALERAAEFTPDVILLDLSLPDGDGFEVCRRMRAFLPKGDVCIIAVTGWGSAESEARALREGFNDYLVKPVEVLRILEAAKLCQAAIAK